MPAPKSISSIPVKLKTVKVSSPVPPITRSVPSPPSIISTPLFVPSNMKSSSPLPPLILSSSSPPISKSRSSEPVIVSLPASPKNLCGTELSAAMRVSPPAVPVIVLNTLIWKVAVSVAPALSCAVYVIFASPRNARLSTGDVYVQVPSPLSAKEPCPASAVIAIILIVSASAVISLKIRSDSSMTKVWPFSATSPYNPSSSAVNDPPVTVIVIMAVSVPPLPSLTVYSAVVSSDSEEARASKSPFGSKLTEPSELIVNNPPLDPAIATSRLPPVTPITVRTSPVSGSLSAPLRLSLNILPL